MALAKAQESIEIAENRFIALPPRLILGRDPDLHRLREYVARPLRKIDEQKINERKGPSYGRVL
jgi:hypothetical protein